jgi:RNA polymerase sigma factor (sigma-70 family)
MDLIQAGNVGLIIGIQRFNNTEYGCRIATYCNYWIKFFIREALKDYASQKNNFEELEETYGDNIVDKKSELSTRVSQDIVDLVFKPLSPPEKLIMVYSYGLDVSGKMRTLKDISTVLGITLERVRQLREGAKKKLKKEEIRDLIT